MELLLVPRSHLLSPLSLPLPHLFASFPPAPSGPTRTAFVNLSPRAPLLPTVPSPPLPVGRLFLLRISSARPLCQPSKAHTLRPPPVRQPVIVSVLSRGRGTSRKKKSSPACCLLCPSHSSPFSLIRRRSSPVVCRDRRASSVSPRQSRTGAQAPTPCQPASRSTPRLPLLKNIVDLSRYHCCYP